MAQILRLNWYVDPGKSDLFCPACKIGLFDCEDELSKPCEHVRFAFDYEFGFHFTDADLGDTIRDKYLSEGWHANYPEGRDMYPSVNNIEKPLSILEFLIDQWDPPNSYILELSDHGVGCGLRAYTLLLGFQLSDLPENTQAEFQDIC